MYFLVSICWLSFVFTTCFAFSTDTVFHIINGYRLDRVDGSSLGWMTGGENACAFHCLSNQDYRTFFVNKRSLMCRFYSLSPFMIQYELVPDPDWSVYYRVNTTSWIHIAKFSSFKEDYFNGHFSYELWSNPDSKNTQNCAVGNVDLKCHKHYVHRSKDLLLSSNSIKKIKVSLYENGTEAAWTIFEKKSGADDNWFQPSRVVDSFPWDTELLRSSAEMSLAPQEHDSSTRFSILKAKRGYPVRPLSPHKYWMKIQEKSNPLFCESADPTPWILFSKGPNPTLLSRSSVSLLVNWTAATGSAGGGALSWNDAETFCRDHLGVTVATWNEVDDARVNNAFQCCVKGWMAHVVTGGGVAGYPMNEAQPACGGRVGMVGWQLDGGGGERWDVYCRADQQLVGLADTLVISVNA